MWRLYYILFVYLKSFKELNFRLEAKVDTKVSTLSLTTKTFPKLFQKKFSADKDRKAFSRSLVPNKVRYSRHFCVCTACPAFQLRDFPSRKGMQRYTLFSFLQYLLLTFFHKNHPHKGNYLLINNKYELKYFIRITNNLKTPDIIHYIIIYKYDKPQLKIRRLN